MLLWAVASGTVGQIIDVCGDLQYAHWGSLNSRWLVNSVDTVGSVRWSWLFFEGGVYCRAALSHATSSDLNCFNILSKSRSESVTSRLTISRRSGGSLARRTGNSSEPYESELIPSDLKLRRWASVSSNSTRRSWDDDRMIQALTSLASPCVWRGWLVCCRIFFATSPLLGNNYM